jgi:hypothetical protein
MRGCRVDDNHVSGGLCCSQHTCVHSISLNSNPGGRQDCQSQLLIASNRNQFWELGQRSEVVK